MMKSAPRKPVQTQLWKIMHWELVDPKHELILLTGAIDCERIRKAMAGDYSSDNGRPFCPVRLLAGLTMLRYQYGLSEQQVLDGWGDNPHRQFFSGGTFFEHEPSVTHPTLSRWRARLGEKGAEEMLCETHSCA